MAAISCGNAGTNNAGSSADSAANLNRTKFDTSATSLTTADFLVSLYVKGLYDQQASEAIGKKIPGGPVGKFARAAGQAQASLNASIARLAGEKQVSLPQRLSTEQQQQLTQMIQAGGADMERSYVRQLTNDQKEMMVTLQQGTQSNDTDVIHWAQGATSALQALSDRTGKVQAYVDSIPLGRGH